MSLLAPARSVRDALLDAAELVAGRAAHSEAYASVQGQTLAVALTLTTPGVRLLRATAVRAAAELGLPVRADAISLARRLTGIEVRLDDLAARIDRLDRLGRLDAKLDTLLEQTRPEAVPTGG